MSTVAVKMGDLVSKYDGGGDFLEWVDKLELVAELQDIKDLHLVLPLFLTGGAFAVYKSIDNKARKDYDKVKDALKLAFSSDPITAYEELQARHLRPGESVDVYVADLDRLAQLVDSTMPSTVIKCAFICGLPADVKMQLKAACKLDGMTLAEVVDRARSLVKSGHDACLVAAVKRSDASRVSNSSGEGHTRNRRRMPVSRPIRCFACDEEGHISRDCPRRARERKCFVCGDAGHLAPSCPQRFGAAKNE